MSKHIKQPTTNISAVLSKQHTRSTDALDSHLVLRRHKALAVGDNRQWSAAVKCHHSHAVHAAAGARVSTTHAVEHSHNVHTGRSFHRRRYGLDATLERVAAVVLGVSLLHGKQHVQLRRRVDGSTLTTAWWRRCSIGSRDELNTQYLQTTAPRQYKAVHTTAWACA